MTRAQVFSQKKLRFYIPLLLVALATGCKEKKASHPYPDVDIQRQQLSGKFINAPIRLLDSARLIADLAFLSSDSCAGRKPGTQGHKLAEEYIIRRFREAGLDSMSQWRQPFMLQEGTKKIEAGNIIGLVRGTQYPGKYLVVSAHYDHLGTQDGKIYFGASDNASGVACLLGLSRYFQQHPAPYSLLFVAFDAEESGLNGAIYFTDHLPGAINIRDIVLNLNIDMIARNDRHELFASGIEQFPVFRAVVEAVQPQTNTHLLMGHDYGHNHDEWTNQSDHYAFYLKNIPFLYLGVEDHPDYHQPTDTFDKIDKNEFTSNCNLAALILLQLPPAGLK